MRFGASDPFGKTYFVDTFATSFRAVFGTSPVSYNSKRCGPFSQRRLFNRPQGLVSCAAYDLCDLRHARDVVKVYKLLTRSFHPSNFRRHAVRFPGAIPSAMASLTALIALSLHRNTLRGKSNSGPEVVLSTPRRHHSPVSSCLPLHIELARFPRRNYEGLRTVNFPKKTIVALTWFSVEVPSFLVFLFLKAQTQGGHVCAGRRTSLGLFLIVENLVRAESIVNMEGSWMLFIAILAYLA